MSYRICIRKNDTGELKIVDSCSTWDDGSLYWLTEGNFSCDCNRVGLWLGGLGTDDDSPCGDAAYSLLWAEVDGERIRLDD